MSIRWLRRWPGVYKDHQQPETKERTDKVTSTSDERPTKRQVAWIAMQLGAISIQLAFLTWQLSAVNSTLRDIRDHLSLPAEQKGR